MERHLWDPYANWQDVAKASTAADVKDKITGHKGMWQPNTMSDALRQVLRNIFDEQETRGAPVATVVDFGCGLGRNLPLLRGMFHRVVGFDIPEMIQRLRDEQAAKRDLCYDATYSDLDVLLREERIDIVYDSVVLQHITSVEFVADLVDRLAAAPTLAAIVSISHMYSHVMAQDFFIGLHQWATGFSEIDNSSFLGHPHTVKVLRRPVRWTLQVRDGVIGIAPEDGAWRAVTIGGQPAQPTDSWLATGVSTQSLPVLMVLFEQPAARAAWFVDESGRYLGDTAEALPEPMRSVVRGNLRQTLALLLHRQFSRAGFKTGESLLSLALSA